MRGGVYAASGTYHYNQKRRLLDFNKSRQHLNESVSVCLQAKEYFEMDGFVTDHIEILQDHSALFRALAFFEDDLERRCKMHKRRVDMLEPICNGTTWARFPV